MAAAFTYVRWPYVIVLNRMPHARACVCVTRMCPQVVAALGCITGPFSFVYWCPGRRALYYGRDPVGRRSLVVRNPGYVS